MAQGKFRVGITRDNLKPDGKPIFSESAFRILDEAWDLPVLLARVDQAEQAVAAVDPGDSPELKRDLIRFRDHLDDARQWIVDRPAYLRHWLPEP